MFGFASQQQVRFIAERVSALESIVPVVEELKGRLLSSAPGSGDEAPNRQIPTPEMYQKVKAARQSGVSDSEIVKRVLGMAGHRYSDGKRLLDQMIGLQPRASQSLKRTSDAKVVVNTDSQQAQTRTRRSGRRGRLTVAIRGRNVEMLRELESQMPFSNRTAIVNQALSRVLPQMLAEQEGGHV